MTPSPTRDRTRDTVVRSEPLVRSRASHRYSERCVAPLATASAARSRRCAALGRSTTSPREVTNRTAPSRRTHAVAMDPPFRRGAYRTPDRGARSLEVTDEEVGELPGVAEGDAVAAGDLVRDDAQALPRHPSQEGRGEAPVVLAQDEPRGQVRPRIERPGRVPH